MSLCVQCARQVLRVSPSTHRHHTERKRERENSSALNDGGGDAHDGGGVAAILVEHLFGAHVVDVQLLVLRRLVSTRQIKKKKSNNSGDGECRGLKIKPQDLAWPARPCQGRCNRVRGGGTYAVDILGGGVEGNTRLAEHVVGRTPEVAHLPRVCEGEHDAPIFV
jgi:hypothetical protein